MRHALEPSNISTIKSGEAERRGGGGGVTWMIAWGTKCLDDIIHGYYLFIGLMTSLLRRHM